ncbi:hypothetical protein RUND412_002425 [Rhizina undulata]
MAPRRQKRNRNSRRSEIPVMRILRRESAPQEATPSVPGLLASIQDTSLPQSISETNQGGTENAQPTADKDAELTADKDKEPTAEEDEAGASPDNIQSFAVFDLPQKRSQDEDREIMLERWWRQDPIEEPFYLHARI